MARELCAQLKFVIDDAFCGRIVSLRKIVRDSIFLSVGNIICWCFLCIFQNGVLAVADLPIGDRGSRLNALSNFEK